MNLASRFVDVEKLPWEKTAYAGIEQKTLLFDRDTGLVTALMRMAPGVRLPDHEHVEIEQTYVLQGSLVCPEGECRAGEFVWRPAGSRSNRAGSATENCMVIAGMNPWISSWLMVTDWRSAAIDTTRPLAVYICVVFDGPVWQAPLKISKLNNRATNAPKKNREWSIEGSPRWIISKKYPTG